MEAVGYMNILGGYPSSVFQDFEIYLRTEIDLVKEDIRLVLSENNSSFITYELTADIYFFKDLTEAFFNILQSEYLGPSKVTVIEFDDITIKYKLVVRDGIIAIRFDEFSFFSFILGFTPHWNYKHYNEYIIQKIVNLSSTSKIRLNSDGINGSVVNEIRDPILFSFVLDKPAGYKVFCEPETIRYKRLNKPVLNTITFYLENNNKEEGDFNQEKLTFTLQMIKN